MRVLRNLTARSLLTARCYPPELSLFPEPSIVDGDSQRSNQVFANLLDNAEPGTVAPAAPFRFASSDATTMLLSACRTGG
jgi:hypothetical protein